MKNKQVIINSLPEGKLTESNYRLVESEIPEISSDQVLVKTISFAITRFKEFFIKISSF